jgi:hypothetical protein
MRKKREISKLLDVFEYALSICMKVAAWSKVRTVFDRLNTGIMSLNRTQGVSVCIYSVFMLSCVGSVLVMVWSPIHGVQQTVYKIKKLKWKEAFHRCPMPQEEQQSNRKYEWMITFVRKLWMSSSWTSEPQFNSAYLWRGNPVYYCDCAFSVQKLHGYFWNRFSY